MQPNDDDTNKEFSIKLAVCHINMQDNGVHGSSFSLLEDKFNGSMNIMNVMKANKKSNEAFSLSQKEALRDFLDSDDSEDDEEIKNTSQFINVAPELAVTDALSHVNGIRQRIPSAGPSGRQTVTKLRSPTVEEQQIPISSDSESEMSDDHKKDKNIPGEYDPDEYQDLDVTNEIKDLFQYITKYIPQNLNLDYKFKPFIPDYIPAVGDIDAFLKVNPPELSITNEKSTIDQLHLGLTVLDEPSATQSDPALLHLQLRASSVNVSHTANVVVKKVDNIEKNSKTIDKWIKDITDLHRSKTSPIVKYSDPMPDLDDLMQAWPEDMENSLKVHGFPNHRLCSNLNQYIDIVCCLFNIPVYKNKIQSLHLLFSLYAAIKNSQLYRAANMLENQPEPEKGQDTDQLVLE